MARILISILLTSTLHLISAAQTLTTYFVEPPGRGPNLQYSDNNVYALKSKLRLRWTTFQSSYSIWLWQQNLTVAAAAVGNPVFTKGLDQDEPGYMTWTVNSQAFDLNESNVFFFALGPSVTLDRAVTCHYFNLSAASLLSTTTTPLTTPTLTASSSSPDSSSTVGSSSTPSASASPDSDTSEPHGLAIGIGVAVGTVVTLLIVAGVVMASRRRQLRKQNARIPASEPSPTWKRSIHGTFDNYLQKKAELPATGVVLPDISVRDRSAEVYTLYELEARDR